MVLVSGQEGRIPIKPITRISYSYLHLLACPYASFLRYQAAIKGPQSPYAARGSALHKALEIEHSHDGEFDLNNAVKAFKAEFLRIVQDEDVFVDWPMFKKMEAQGIDYLVLYYNDLKEGKFPAPSFVEREFVIPFEGIEIVGKIDVEQVGDEDVVVDYKSGSAKPDRWMLRHNLQFTCYAWAFLEERGKLPDKLIWHHLKDGSRLPTERTMEDIEQLKQIIRNAVRMNEMGIRHRIFHENVCDLCEYSGTRGRKNAICDDTDKEQQLVQQVTEAYKSA